MNARLYDRFAAGVSVALLLGLAAGSYYLAELADRFFQPGDERAAADRPDSFAEGVVLLRLNDRGHPAFRLSARRMEHFRDSDTSTFEYPEMLSLDPDRPHITLSARQGRSTRNQQEIQLQGEVLLVRAAAPGEPALTVRTDYAQVFADSEVARSDRPVTIRRGESTLTGTGMEFNNRARTLSIHAEARALWSSAPSRP